MADIAEVLKERGSRYGEFKNHAEIAQGLKHEMHVSPGWKRLDKDMKEALEMVQHKIARILNGDPQYLDNWVDGSGYIKLVADRLEAREDPQSALSNDGWFDWKGGERPVPVGALVDVVHRGGQTHLNQRAGRNGRAEFWKHLDCDGDIISYRLSSQASQS